MIPLMSLSMSHWKFFENLTCEEKPVKILDRKDQVLLNRAIPLVKVFWRNHAMEEATWECEDEIKTKNPHLFEYVFYP